MSNIKGLIKKYETPTKAEKTTNEYNKKIRLEIACKNRHLILDQLLLEIPFHLNQSQVQQIRYWIDTFNKDFKNFHRQSSNETIILALIFIQRKKVNPRLHVTKYTISKKYNLTTPIFEVIQNKLIFQLMKTTPLTYTQAKHYNHDILVKKGY